MFSLGKVTRPVALGVVMAVVACGKHVTRAPTVTGGNADRGKVEIQHYGCGSCHTIPGIKAAQGIVGPSLEHFGQRTYIAGVLSNQPENAVRWIANPPAVDAKTAMPVLGVSDRDARDIAEYLYSRK